MKESFLLGWRSLMRSKTLWLMLGAVALIHLVMPSLARSDGTAASECAMVVKLAFGASMAVVLIGTLVAAAGALPDERSSKRLQLTLVRPARAFGVVAGRWLSVVAMATAALSLSSLLLAFRPGFDPGRARREARPVMESVESVAESMIDEYLADPDTPEPLKTMERSRVISHLAQLENERRVVLAPGSSLKLPFEVDPSLDCAAQIRFDNLYGMHMEFKGFMEFAGKSAHFTNTTERILEIPLESGSKSAAVELEGGRPEDGKQVALTVGNEGRMPFILRPRRDIALLVDGGPFAVNLALCTLAAICMAAALAALGIFLGSALSRPVAVFAAAVMLMASAMAPGIVASQPDRAKDIGLVKAGMAISRAVAASTGQLLSATPTEHLSRRLRIPGGEVVQCVGVCAVAFPLVMLGLASFMLRRKPM